MIEAGFKSVQEKLGKQVETAIEKYEGQVKELGKASTEARDEVRALAEEYKKISEAIKELAQKAVSGSLAAIGFETAGEEFIKSDQFKSLIAGSTQKVRLAVKNTVTAVSGTTTYPLQRPGVVAGAFQPLTIRQLFRAIPVSTNMVTGLRELAWTNSAAEVSQGAAKPESDITFEQYDTPIQTVAHWIKVSNQLLADAPAIAAYIDTRLRDGLAQRVDAQLLNGNGTSPSLSGLTDSGNYTAYSATSDDLLVDAINRAKYSLWSSGYVPDVAIVNPSDWGAMERTRETGGGQYLYGAPGMAAGNNPFGVRIVLSANMTAGNFYVAALDRSSVLYTREGATVEMGYVNDDFTKNLVTIRAEERLGLGTDVPGATRYGAFTA